MTNILLEDLDVSLWEELDDVSASKISGGEGIGQEASGFQEASRELGFKNGNEFIQLLGAKNFGQATRDVAQQTNGPSPE
ncbi:MAG TPA: hypothetical protein VE944_26615 [Nostoc sp.]|uniref:hypothetical protein n=1 Tax=Nostoc sp. TaxID=1180 RepID=UPI002D463DA9|nr:hypothetical protein [Nostoc sp.]HYX17868.1 hypothetical protein [Nostoc sp.]